MSLLEQKDAIDRVLLQKISDILKIPVEAFENFDKDSAINIISNTVNNNDNATGNSLFNYYPTINTFDQFVKLHEEKIALYERMLKEKDDMMHRLEALLSK